MEVYTTLCARLPYGVLRELILAPLDISASIDLMKMLQLNE
jgi:hypothetical protein